MAVKELYQAGFMDLNFDYEWLWWLNYGIPGQWSTDDPLFSLREQYIYSRRKEATMCMSSPEYPLP